MPIPNSNLSCNITGCNYCLTNNTCALCFGGYNLTNGTCNVLCNISNCFECFVGNNTCSVCEYGYYLSTVSGLCINASNQTSTYCTTNFGTFCLQCSYYTCTQCSPSYTINPQSTQCCPSPTLNYANCASYKIQWSNTTCSTNITCNLCNPGSLSLQLFPSSPLQCILLPCNLPNCINCYKS
jgi:hypothetical protein